MELTLFLAAYIVFVFSLVAHEGAHAIVAKWGGDWTAYNRGQASLNPVPHIRREPAGLVVIPILTYLSGGFMMGWASAPYHVEWSRRYPGRAALMAAAGPAANLLLVLASSALVFWMVRNHGWGLSAGGWDGLLVNAEGNYDLWTRTVSMCWMQNLLLALFNLIPVPPLDVSAMLSGVLPNGLRQKWQVAITDPRVAGVGILVVWLGFGRLWRPAFKLAYGWLAALVGA